MGAGLKGHACGKEGRTAGVRYTYTHTRKHTHIHTYTHTRTHTHTSRPPAGPDAREPPARCRLRRRLPAAGVPGGRGDGHRGVLLAVQVGNMGGTVTVIVTVSVTATVTATVLSI
mgnify:CR=1 FL=1